MPIVAIIRLVLLVVRLFTLVGNRNAGGGRPAPVRKRPGAAPAKAAPGRRPVQATYSPPPVPVEPLPLEGNPFDEPAAEAVLPVDPESRYLRFKMLSDSDPGAAFSYVRDLLDLDLRADHKLTHRIARNLVRRKEPGTTNWPLALELAHQAAKMAPEDPEYLLTLGEAFAGNGDPRKAVKAFKLAEQKSTGSRSLPEKTLTYLRKRLQSLEAAAPAVQAAAPR